MIKCKKCSEDMFKGLDREDLQHIIDLAQIKIDNIKGEPDIGVWEVTKGSRIIGMFPDTEEGVKMAYAAMKGRIIESEEDVLSFKYNVSFGMHRIFMPKTEAEIELRKYATGSGLGC